MTAPGATSTTEGEPPSFTTATDLDLVWRILTTTPGIGRWLGADVGVDEMVPFVVPGAPQLSGRIVAVDSADGERRTITVDVGGEPFSIRFDSRTTDDGRRRQTVVSVAGDRLHGPWRRALTAAAHLVGEYHRHDPRQAVIIVHGIGDQRPGSTLKGFVASVLADDADGADGRPPFWSKPDRLAETMELRRYQAPKTASRPKTDFYEYYWAPEIARTSLAQLQGWVSGLLKRPLRDIPPRFKTIWFASRIGWIAGMVALAFLTIGVVTELGDAILDSREFWNGWKRVVWVATLIALLASGVAGFLQKGLGDAARYLRARPENIALRSSIRESGLGLLRKLHDSGDYDRIVLVGHSLGSVIAYDLLRLYWAEVHDRHRSPDDPQGQALRHYEDALTEMASTGVPPTPDEQFRVWREQRRNGVPWLITDFVTAGSPLTYSELLLTEGVDDLALKRTRRELPTCPPEPEWHAATGSRPARASIHHRVRYPSSDRLRDIEVLDHAAVFGPTCWTNLYFRSRLLLFGDSIGGPVGQHFGPGVVDIPIDHAWKPALHTRYWKGASGPARRARRCMLDALRLDLREELESLADELPVGDRLATTSTIDP